MRGLLLLLFGAGVLTSRAQELYVFTEPASNVPSRSVSTRLSSHLTSQNAIYNRFTQRHYAGLLAGISKKFMLHTGISFSDMHTPDLRQESFYLYAKYRFLSKDDIHKHFRMAAYLQGALNNNPFHYEDVNVTGDKAGFETGVVATQLWHKLALSATISQTQLLHKSRYNKVIYIPERIYQSFNYSLSAGYLLLPREYKSYRQLNLNLYAELLAQQTWPQRTQFHDLGTAIQLIFNSKTKINLGYRFQLGGTMQRMASRHWLLTYERTFLNALPRKKK